MSEERENLVDLGAFIRSQRRLAKLSQRELAKLSKLSDPYVSQIERGLHEPSMRVIRSIAGALNLPVDTLLRHAGWRDNEEADAAPDTEGVIRDDPRLTDAQKAAMLEIYRGFVA